MNELQAGNLFVNAAPPPEGERFETLLAHKNLVVERIVSSDDITLTEYVQTQDEWVALLRGEALLEVAGKAHVLNPDFPLDRPILRQRRVWRLAYAGSGGLRAASLRPCSSPIGRAMASSPVHKSARPRLRHTPAFQWKIRVEGGRLSVLAVRHAAYGPEGQRGRAVACLACPSGRPDLIHAARSLKIPQNSSP